MPTRSDYHSDPLWLEVLANLTGPMPTTLERAAARLNITKKAVQTRLTRAGYRLECGPDGAEKSWKKVENLPVSP